MRENPIKSYEIISIKIQIFVLISKQLETIKCCVIRSNQIKARTNGYLYYTHHPSVLSRVLLVLDLDIPDLQLVVYATHWKNKQRLQQIPEHGAMQPSNPCHHSLLCAV
jgi:hypothetical protein